MKATLVRRHEYRQYICTSFTLNGCNSLHLSGQPQNISHHDLPLKKSATALRQENSVRSISSCLTQFRALFTADSPNARNDGTACVQSKESSMILLGLVNKLLKCIVRSSVQIQTSRQNSKPK
ncbi:hypothetical protein RB195_025995 [Necator americanus]|uniref:Uncharacterized protein n=1 Tax=Necator americanus TaxID=51031 RepID=A0ABR1EV31_NECAM